MFYIEGLFVMGPINVTSTSVMSLKNIYNNVDESEISELRKQNNKRLEELLQQGRKEMNRRMKNESDAGSSANANNYSAEIPDQEQNVREPDESETRNHGLTEIQDPCSESVQTNKFDWKQNNTEFQIEECKLQVLPKKSEKLKECLFKNSEIFEGTRTPKNKYRKRRQHSDRIVDLSLALQERNKQTSSKLPLEPSFVSTLLPATNVWLQKRGVDLFPESQQSRVNLTSCTTTEEKMLEMALAASLVTAAKEGSMETVEAEQANQIHKSLSTASSFIPPTSTENENWDSDGTESELASLEFENDNYSYAEQNKTDKSPKNREEVTNNSVNKCTDIFNAQVKSLKNRCNVYEKFQSHENIELTGAVGITEKSEVSCNLNNNITKDCDKNCNNNQRTYFSSECVNRNRPQYSNDKKIQEFKHIGKTKSDIKSFETDNTPTASSTNRLGDVRAQGDKLSVKSNRITEKSLDIKVIDDKPLHKSERVATTKRNFTCTSKQAENLEIMNNKDLKKNKPSQEHVIKLNNPEIKKINHKTCYFHRSQSTEPLMRSGSLPSKREKPIGSETGSSKSINEGVHKSCELYETDNLKNVTYGKASADYEIQQTEDNVMVDTGGTQETALKIDDKGRSTSNKIVEPLMQEVAIEQLLRYEPVAKDFENTVSHHSSKEQAAAFVPSKYPTSARYGCTSMFQRNTIPGLQTTWNPVTNLSYNQFPTITPHIKQAIPTGWVPYLSPGVSQPPAVLQAHLPPDSVLMGPQLAFMNPSQHPGHNLHVHQPPGIMQRSHCVVKSNCPEQTRSKYDPILVPPPSLGSLCNPYFPVPAPQAINSQQVASKITSFEFQQHREFVPVVQLECGTNNSTDQLTENLVSQEYCLPPRIDTVNPHLSQASLHEVMYSHPPPPKAELYYQNLQNMMQVDPKTLNQEMRNLLLQPGSVGLPFTSYGCTTDFGRQKQIQNTPQVMTNEQNMTELQWSQAGSSHSGTCITNKFLDSRRQVPLVCGDSSPLTWQQEPVPLTRVSGQNHSTATLPPTPESTNVQSKGVTPITSLSLAAKGRGRHRNPNL